jgi:hypothetical protein
LCVCIGTTDGWSLLLARPLPLAAPALPHAVGALHHPIGRELESSKGVKTRLATEGLHLRCVREIYARKREVRGVASWAMQGRRRALMRAGYCADCVKERVRV